MHYQKSGRTAKGQILLEGALGFVMVTFGCILALILVINSCVGAAYKTRLATVTNLAAQYAVNQSSGQTTTFVQQLMRTLCMTPNHLKVTLQPATIDAQTGVLVSVSNQFPILGNGTYVPMQLQITDTEFATNIESSPGTGSSN
jgi:hypothetical protein